MDISLKPPENDLNVRLKYLMFFRVIFSVLLLGSTIVRQLQESPSPVNTPLLVLYGLTAGIFVLTVIYTAMFFRVKRFHLFAYLQTGVDTVVVTFIIFVTGGFSSIFSFLYLVVIIYSSILLFRKGSMMVAALCSLQYGIMIDFEYYGILEPIVMGRSFSAAEYDWGFVIYKITITVAACFAVAILSSLLSEQAKKSKTELLAMEEQVKQVEKLAAIGEMAAGLAHEIKNPLASIAGSIQLLREEVRYNAGQDKLMLIILREADRLNALLSNFLLFARPPAGKVQQIDLAGALEETVELFEKDLACYGKILVTKLISRGVWVAMDPTHLRQVLWNLLNNAAEAIKNSGHIDIHMEPLKNRAVAIRITDDGCGIAPGNIQSIFNPFFTTKADGTGLGLSIVHSILKSYGNRIEVQSVVNRGTTFTLRLKATDSPT